jgi:hypothetical protein
MSATDSLTISTATDSDRGTAPRHRDEARPIKYGPKASVAASAADFRRAIDRASTAMIGDPKETQR